MTRELQPPRLPNALDRHEPDEPPEEVDWTGLELVGDLTGWLANDVEIAECRLAGVRLTGADLGRVRLTDVVVEGCDLSGATLGKAVLRRVVLRDCRMSGAVLAGAQLDDVVFADCKLDGANFRMTKGERVLFDRSILREADFYEARLTAAAFFDCELTGAEMTKAGLAGARLHGSTLDDLRGAQHLKGVVVETSQVLPLAFRVYAGLGIVVDDEREPDDR